MNNKLTEFKSNVFKIFDKYNINKLSWSQLSKFDNDFNICNYLIIDNIDSINKLNNNKAFKEFDKLLNKYGYKFLSDNFGNDVKITLKKDFIQINEICIQKYMNSVK